MNRKLQITGLLVLFLITACKPQLDDNTTMSKKVETTTMKTVKGSFEVKMNPIDGTNEFELDKSYSGPLTATAKGKMLTAYGSKKGSASYVAIETVEGELDGKKGSFTLVHRGVMHAGKDELSVSISPESGTDELAGITGDLDINIEDGQHYYVLNYTLAE